MVMVWNVSFSVNFKSYAEIILNAKVASVKNVMIFWIILEMVCRLKLMKMGLTFEDILIAAKYFAKTGFNAIDVTGGMVGNIHYTSQNNILKKEDTAYHAEYANRIANKVSIPVIVIGGLLRLIMISCSYAMVSSGLPLAASILFKYPRIRSIFSMYMGGLEPIFDFANSILASNSAIKSRRPLLSACV